MTADKAKRELDEECSIERVKAAIRGDMMVAKLDDAMRRAAPLAERGGLTPLALTLIGTLYRGVDEGYSLWEQKGFFVRQHDGSGEMADKWDAAIDQLRRHNLLPPGLRN